MPVSQNDIFLSMPCRILPHFPQDSLDLAHQLCIQHGIFDRPLGLLGVWGGIVRQWLDMLLPEDAAVRYGV
jgi:hypothetical protein